MKTDVMRPAVALRRGLFVALVVCPWLAGAADGLSAALQSAVTLNPEVKSKLAELESLGYKVKEAEAGRYPSLSLEARTLHDSTSKGLLRLQQPLWAFGKIDGNITVAERRKAAAELELFDINRRLLEDTGAAYVQAQSLRQRVKVAEANLSEHQSLHEMIRRRQAGGVAADADVRLALSRLTQARAQRDQLQAQLEKGLEDLFALTRVRMPAEQPVPDGVVALPNPATLTADLEGKYVKLRLQELRLEIVEAETRLRKAELMPTISARIDHDIQPSGTSQYDHDRAGVVFEGRIDGAGLAGYQRLKSEAARQQSAREDIETARKEGERKLHNLLVERRVQQQMIESQTLVVDSVNDTLQSFLRQYDAGRKSWVDVLNTQRELSEARQQLEQVRAAWKEAGLRTAAMLGYLDGLAGLK